MEDKLIKEDIGLVDEILELCKNLVSIESHAFGSYVSSKNEKFLKISKKARQLRTKYLSVITKNESQGWCISKHICECLMRLQECYTRFLSTNQVEEAKICAKDYFDMYALFILLNDLDKDIKTKSSA
ncbi:unnamed protein product [marine sediment metagenome]|uniref:Uncharacterized protein n=1 Tax=marine sediment metagenome TaxID=412755 RepID=X0Z9N7_9ZZZZ